MEHNHRIEWPNGMGYTPCSKEYRLAMDERDAIYEPGDTGTMDALSPEDYQRWHELDHALLNMQLQGHLGKPVRY